MAGAVGSRDSVTIDDTLSDTMTTVVACMQATSVSYEPAYVFLDLILLFVEYIGIG